MFSLIDTIFYDNLSLFRRKYIMKMQESTFSFTKQNWC